MRKILLFIFITALLTGCATSRKNERVRILESRVAELESQLQEKEMQFIDLQSSLEAPSQLKESPKASLKPTPKRIQAALKNAGFYKGAVDGKVGKKTRRAIEEFQKANGLKSDGIVGTQTWDRLCQYMAN